MKITPNKVLALFVTVPFIFSVVSTIHLIVFAALGNAAILAILFGVTVELGALVTFIALSPNILKRLNKGMVLFMFILLFALQAVGNVYAIFDFIIKKLKLDPSWLDSFNKLTLETMDPYMQTLTIAGLLGLFVPVLSLMLLKSAIDYLGKNANDETPNDGVSEGINEGVSEGINEGVSEGINEGVSEGINEGVSEGINEGVNMVEELTPSAPDTVNDVVTDTVNEKTNWNWIKNKTKQLFGNDKTHLIEESAANSEKTNEEKDNILGINKKKRFVVHQQVNTLQNEDEFYKKHPEEKY